MPALPLALRQVRPLSSEAILLLRFRYAFHNIVRGQVDDEADGVRARNWRRHFWCRRQHRPLNWQVLNEFEVLFRRRVQLDAYTESKLHTGAISEGGNTRRVLNRKQHRRQCDRRPICFANFLQVCKPRPHTPGAEKWVGRRPSKNEQCTFRDSHVPDGLPAPASSCAKPPARATTATTAREPWRINITRPCLGSTIDNVCS